MPRVVCLLGAAALCLLTSTAQAQQNYYRPLHLQDMVKAVGTNTEGMPPAELPKRITTYALHIGDTEGVGVSARFEEDPDGPIIVGWRSDGQLWRYAWVEESGLGRLEAFKPIGSYFALETRQPDGRFVSVILRTDLSVVGLVNGQPRGAKYDNATDTLIVSVRAADSTADVSCREVKTRTGGYCR
jgi:hypothetical protein